MGRPASGVEMSWTRQDWKAGQASREWSRGPVPNGPKQGVSVCSSASMAGVSPLKRTLFVRTARGLERADGTVFQRASRRQESRKPLKILVNPRFPRAFQGVSRKVSRKVSRGRRRSDVSRSFRWPA